MFGRDITLNNKKKLSEAWEFLSDIEKKYELYSFKIYDYPVWNGCKEKFLDLIIGDEELKKSAEKRLKIKLKNIIVIMRRMFDGFLKILKLRKVDVLFVSNSRFRRGDWKSENSHIYFDNIIDTFDKDIKYKFLEYPTLSDYDNKYYKSRYSINVIPVDVFGVFALVTKIIKRHEINNSYREVDELIKKLSDELDEVLLNKMSHCLKYASREWIVWNSALSWLYKKLSPTLIIDIANASRFSYKSIPNVNKLEIQHGIIHKFHPAYSIPSAGKGGFQYFYRNKSIIVHNYDYKQILSNYGVIKPEGIFAVERLSQWGFELEDRNTILKRLNIDPNKKIIMLSSQPLVEAQKEFVNFIKYFSSLRNNNIKFQDYIVIVKLHPREDKETSLYKFFSDILIVTNEVNLWELLSVSDIHIGYTSTVIEEAIDYKVLNLILPGADINGKFDNLININKAIKLKHLTDFEKVNKEALNNKDNSSQAESINENPYINVKNIINTLLKAK